MGIGIRTVESITKGLRKIHDSLRSHADERRIASAHAASAAAASHKQSLDHDAEARRADEIADNLKKLLGE